MDARTKKIFKEFQERKSKYVGRMLKLTSRYVEEQVEKMWKERGFEDIRTGHIALIANIHPDGTSVNTLAEKAYTSKQAMSQILKELEEFGYVESTTDPEDKRAKVIKLTEKGIAFIELLLHCGKEIDKRFTKILGKEKMQQFTELQFELVSALYPTYCELMKK